MARVMCSGRAMKTLENALPLAGFTTGVIAAGSTSIMCPLIYGVVIFVSNLTRTGRRGRCHMDQGAGIGIFQHPQRAVGALFHIADAVAHIPALGRFGAAMAVKDDAVERLGTEAADKAVAIPL